MDATARTGVLSTLAKPSGCDTQNRPIFVPGHFTLSIVQHHKQVTNLARPEYRHIADICEHFHEKDVGGNEQEK